MTRESIEELRERLLRDEQVQEVIRMRAYEIYLIRGEQSGGQAEDWFLAETEVLEFLINEESSRESQAARPPMNEVRSEGPRSFEPRTASEITERGAEPAAQTAEQRTQSRSGIGVWSAAEPTSAELAPSIGAPAQSTKPEAAEKKSRSKSATSGSKASGEEPKASKRTSSKKPSDATTKHKKSKKQKETGE